MICLTYLVFCSTISGGLMLSTFGVALIQPSQVAKQLPNVKVVSIKASHANVIEGDTVDLTCNWGLASLKHVTVEWFHNGVLLNMSSTTISRSEVQLQLINVTRYQSGNYVCAVTQKGESFESLEPLKLQVLYPGIVQSITLDTSIPVANNVVQFTCQFQQGNPPVRVYMGRPSNLLPVQIESNPSTLTHLAMQHFEITAKADSGLYSCRVENGAGFSELARHVNVASKPTVSSIKIINQEVSLGSDVQLQCVISDFGSPRGRISWFKNGYLIKSEDSASLLINNLQDVNLGLYVCEVRNEYGFSSQQIELHQTNKKYEPKSKQLKAERIYFSPAQDSDLVTSPLFLGLFIGALVLLVIIGLIILYVKREKSEVNEDF